MAHKIGRNDLCWCGSNKKFKKCHLDRAEQELPSKEDISKKVIKNFTVKKCYAKNCLEENCSGKIIKAHTISKSATLKSISVSGNVMGLRRKFFLGIKNKSEFSDLQEIGLKTASTFSGFCQYHDRVIFSPIENKHIIPDTQQCLLLAYRGLIYELYAKECSLENHEVLKELDKGKSFSRQLYLQNLITDIKKSTFIAIEKDINPSKKIIENAISKKEYSDFSHLIIELSEVPSVVVSSAVQPDIDFKGNKIQNLNNLDTSASILFVNCICSNNKGFFIFSWIKKDDSICRSLCETLLSLGISEIGNALVRFCFSHFENIFASPIWWKNLPKKKQKNIKKLIGMGFMEERDSNCLTPDKIDYNAIKASKYYYL